MREKEKQDRNRRIAIIRTQGYLMIGIMVTLGILLNIPQMRMTAYAANNYSQWLLSTGTQNFTDKQVTFNDNNTWYIIEDNSAGPYDGTVTLFAVNSIGQSNFNPSVGGNQSYSGSLLQSYLDSLTSTGSFSGVASAIKAVNLTDVGVQNAKLYPLKLSDVDNLPAGVRGLGGSVDWWLRTPSSTATNRVYYVSRNGSIMQDSYATYLYVRPALKLDLTKVTYDSSTRTFSLGNNKVSEVSISGVPVNLDIGDTKTLTATIVPANATDKTIQWSSSDTAVATVDSNGIVTALNYGTAVIKATAINGSDLESSHKSATCVIKVSKPVTGITVSPTTASIEKGSTYQLRESISPSNATNTNVTWSSNNLSVASVSANGLVSANGVGSAIITVTTEDGGKTATCTVTVTQSVTGVSLNKKSAEIETGESLTLMATVRPTDASNKSVTWECDNTSVATVDASGVVTGVNPGTATITVTTVDRAYTANCNITVKNKNDGSGNSGGDQSGNSSGGSSGNTSSGQSGNGGTAGDSNGAQSGNSSNNGNANDGQSASADNAQATIPTDTASENVDSKQKTTTLLKPKASKKSFSLTWKKATAKGIKGYEIQYSTDKSFSKDTTSTKAVNKVKTTSLKIKGLKPKTKYYVRIRTFSKKNGEKVYSKWSRVKSVKVK